MNRYQFIGNVGKDADVRHTQAGSAAISFSVAISESYTDKQGQKVENTTWASCTIWKQPGQSTKIADYLLKGQKVLVEGKPSVRTYQDANGETKATLDIKVDNLELLGGAKQPGATPTAPAPAARPAVQAAPAASKNPFANPSTPQDDDLPF
jgi:single-strand DNA-binding protein